MAQPTTPDQAVSRRHVTPLNMVYFFLGLALLILLLQKIDFQSLLNLIFKIKPEYLLLGGVAYSAKAILRAFRFLRCNGQVKPNLIKMLRLTLASSLASQLLPLKLGELSYIYLLKKDYQSSITQGVSSLMIVRVFDLLAIALLFILISFVVGVPAGLSIYFYFILAFIATILLLLSSLLFISRYYQSVLNFIFRFSVFQNNQWFIKLQRGLENLLHDLSKYTLQQYGEFVITALLEWFINYISFHAILVGAGLTPLFYDTVVAVTFAAFASVLPINSFGNFGTQEAGWASGLVLLGYTQETALTSGFATHLLTLGYMIILGGISWLSYLLNDYLLKKDTV